MTFQAGHFVRAVAPALLSTAVFSAQDDGQVQRAAAPAAVTDWIAANAIPLETPEARHGFAAAHDPDYAETLSRASKLTAARGVDSASFGSATGSFPVHEAAGKRIRFSGRIKTLG